MKKMMIVMAMVVMLSGCGLAEARRWHRPDRDNRQTLIEYTDCCNRASDVWAYDQKIFEECMQEKGFQREDGKIFGVWKNKGGK